VDLSCFAFYLTWVLPDSVNGDVSVHPQTRACGIGEHLRSKDRVGWRQNNSDYEIWQRCNFVLLKLVGNRIHRRGAEFPQREGAEKICANLCAFSLRLYGEKNL